MENSGKEIQDFISLWFISPFGGLYLGKASSERCGLLYLLRTEKLNSLVLFYKNLNISLHPSPHLSIDEKTLLVHSTSQILKNDLGKQYINHCPFES